MQKVDQKERRHKKWVRARFKISESCKIIEFTKIMDLFNIRIHDKNIKYFNKYESIGAEFNFISNKIYTKSLGSHKFDLS